MKKLIRSACALLESFAVVAITFFLGMLFCSAVVLLTEAWVIPTLGRLSYDWFIYFERMEALPPAVEDACPETSVTITKEGHLVAVTRNAAGHPSVFYVSRDGGATWQWEINSMPTAASKLYLWTQKNGRTLLAFNAAADGRSRTRLCLASIDVETLCCQEIYTLAHGECQVGNVYHYPCVVEKDGRLYISCTVNRGTVRSAAVLDIPVFE